MWQAILKLIGVIREIICALCESSVMDNMAERAGWVKTVTGWICPDCQIRWQKTQQGKKP